MGGIILTILKITGITLLVLIAFALLLILAVLFVPIRYQIEGKKETDKGILRGRVTVSWLLHIVHARAVYEGTLRYVIRVFGIPIKKSGGKKRAGKRTKRAKKKKDRVRKVKDKDKHKPSPKEELEKERKSMKAAQHEPIADKGDKGHAEVSEENIKYEELDFKIETCETAEDKQDQEPKGNREPEEDTERRQSLFGKIKEFVGRLWELAIHFKEKLAGLVEKLKHIKENAEFYIAFFSDENTKEQLTNIIIELKKLLRHIKPAKLDVSLVIGTEDPATTGAILGILAILQLPLDTIFKVTPCFDRSIIDFELKGRGRVRIFTVLLVAFKIYFHKGFKQMRQAYRGR